MKLIGDFFSLIFNFCTNLTNNNYWLAIVIFTIFSKIILLPISIIVQKNSIKMVQMYPEINKIKAKFFGNKDMISEKQYELYQEKNYKPILDIIPAIVQVIVLMGVVAGFPKGEVNRNLIFVLAAALSSFILCEVQNRVNVLQHEQSKYNQLGTMVFSVCLSLFLALFVTKYVVFYWICSNLMSAIQVFILNHFINPKKYIDYEDLANSRQELETIKRQNAQNKKKRSKELVAREKTDYKRFIKYENKQIVFYSEKNGFYKYFKDIIEIILKKTDIIIHYISSDPEDEIFKLTQDNFRTYYIDEKIMVLMMQMDADIVVMTTPDLQNYYIKRSMVRDNIEYVYVDHATNSNNLFYHKDALAHYDTIFVQNTKVFDEIKAQEEVYGFTKKNLVKVGCPLIDNMIKSYSKDENRNNKTKTILIAPSWQEDNILDLCIDELLDPLVKTDYQIILRPHPQYIKLYKDKYGTLKNKFSNYTNLVFQDDFSSNKTVYDADVLITDWSGIALEYSFTTLKPVIYINTPMKVINPDYKDIEIVPFNIEARNKIGIEIEVDEISSINERINSLFIDKKYSSNRIKEIRDNYLYNLGNSAKYGAKYLVDSLIEKYNKQTQNRSDIIEKVEQTKEIKTFKEKYKESIIVSLFTCLTLFFFSPMEIYAGNTADFLLPINNIWWIMLIFSICIALILSVLISIFPYKVSKALSMFELLFGLLCYIQMLFLNGDVTSLASSNEETTFSLLTITINALIWIVLIHLVSISFFNNRKIKNNFNKMSLYISVFLIVIQMFGFISNYERVKIDSKNFKYLSNKGQFELSEGENTIVFIFDFCDWKYMNEALEKYPNLFEELDGFTYYPDYLTSYSRTYPSIPYLLTGEPCNYDEPYYDYIDKAWKNSNLIKNLHNNEVNIGIYESPGFIGESAEKTIDNYLNIDLLDINIIKPIDLFKEMTFLSAYRCAPYLLKPIVNNIHEIDIDRAVNIPDSCIYEDDLKFYDTLVNTGLSINNEYSKSFRFYHLLSTHEFMDENFNKGSFSDKPAADTLYADFKIVNYYISEMKKIGIYNESTIVITTDHGIVRDNFNDGEASSGFLLIKHSNETGEVKESDLQTCQNDLFKVLYDNKRINDDINIETNGSKTRYINVTFYSENVVSKYMVDGDARNFDNWHLLSQKEVKFSAYAIKK